MFRSIVKALGKFEMQGKIKLLVALFIQLEITFVVPPSHDGETLFVAPIGSLTSGI